MPGQHPQASCAQRDGAFDKRPRRERPDLAMHQPGDSHPPCEPQHRDDERGARLPQRREQQQQHDAGKREGEVGQSQECDREGAAPVARHRADDHTERDRDQHRQHPDSHRNARTVHQPRPHVPAEPIRADRVKRAVHIGGQRRQKPRRDDVPLRGGVAGGDERGGDGAREHDEQDEGAERAAPIPEQSGGRHVARVRIRGSSHAANTSASRFPATTSTALTAVAAMTTG